MTVTTTTSPPSTTVTTTTTQTAVTGSTLPPDTTVDRPGEPPIDEGSHQLYKILVEQSFHHIGDGVGLSSFLIPDAEGIAWETTFLIPSEQYADAATAHLELFLLDSGYLNSFAINGRSFAVPDNEKLKAAHLPFVSKVLVAIPLGLLESGPNTIRLESGQSSLTSGYDDFEFGEMVLLLSS